MDEAQIRQNVLDELTAYLPVNTDRFHIDYRIQEIIGNGEQAQYKVMVVAVPRDIVSGYLECLQDAGFKVRYVDVAENCYEKLMRFTRGQGDGAGQDWAVIDLGASRTAVSVYKNGGFFVNHLLPVGAGAMMQELCQKTGVDRRATEKQLSA
jgi:Tfp pilus assembly PilM family ATPase